MTCTSCAPRSTGSRPSGTRTSCRAHVTSQPGERVVDEIEQWCVACRTHPARVLDEVLAFGSGHCSHISHLSPVVIRAPYTDVGGEGPRPSATGERSIVSCSGRPRSSSTHFCDRASAPHAGDGSQHDAAQKSEFCGWTPTGAAVTLEGGRRGRLLGCESLSSRAPSRPTRLRHRSDGSQATRRRSHRTPNNACS